MKLIVATLLALLSCQAIAGPQSFSKSKKVLDKKVYHDQQVTFYCGCDYESKMVTKTNGKQRKKLVPDWQSCGFKPRKQAKRASRIEWEHVMPAHHFGQHLQCWRDGGRKNCKKDKVFKRMEADMHNLVPAIGEVNGDRSNYKYGMLDGEQRVYGQCDAEVNFKAKRFEPAPHVRGDIARIYFYMADQYQVRLSKQQRRLFEAWAKSDPVDGWEQERNERIGRVQGNLNPYINTLEISQQADSNKNQL